MNARRQKHYRLDNDGAFVVDDYNLRTPFSSFLPGIAGEWGKPLWTFFVNRGQAICSAGIRDKDGAIMEFQSSNTAYGNVFTHGFRTLLKITCGKSIANYEPFQVHSGRSYAKCAQTMTVHPHAVAISEQNASLGIATDVEYFTLPDDTLPALVRRVALRNTSDSPVRLQMLDGLLTLIPYGTSNAILKSMKNLAQTYSHISMAAPHIPCFSAKISGEDVPLVDETSGMHFCFAFDEERPTRLLPVVVDPASVLAGSTDLRTPRGFLEAKSFRMPARQLRECSEPSALAFSEFSLEPGESRSFVMVLGNAPSEAAAIALSRRARRRGYLGKKREEAKRVVDAVSQALCSISGSPAFDIYSRQTFLDNALRGGFPITLRGGENPLVIHVYSRKHGDLERDYNPFVIEPTVLSQGDGRYRDMNQNRRHDIFFNPDVGDTTLRYFLNLIQANGYNPNGIKSGRFRCAKSKSLSTFIQQATSDSADASLLETLVCAVFEPGKLLASLEKRAMPLTMPRPDFLHGVLRFAEPIAHSEFESGFHTDNWTHNLDLIESYRGLFPDRFHSFLFEADDFVYGDTHVFVKPRSERYAMVRGKPMQPSSLTMDETKKQLIDARDDDRFAMRSDDGLGCVYHTTLAPKLLALAAVKLATLDPFGVGIEMEADRSNWYDALNGLPGVFGSSTCETFELKRLLLLLQREMKQQNSDFQWRFPEEIARFIADLLALLLKPPSMPTSRERAFAFWDAAATLKEDYNARIRMGFSGAERTLSTQAARRFIQLSLKKVNAGLRKAFDRKTGLHHGYYRHELTDYDFRRDGTVIPKGFTQHAQPLFLEAQVHAMRVADSPDKTASIASSVKRSALFDRKLKMYKLNANLESEPLSIGRARSFARGWLENESIWLHMEYKYLLELLRAGLYSEFFKEFRACGIPFLDPKQYGRSPMENVSYIVSSAYPDRSMIGRGYQARLTGATAEFVHMWILICCGEYPFRQNSKGELEAVLDPSIPDWLFTKRRRSLELVRGDGTTAQHGVPRNSFTFLFLCHTVVTYRQEGTPRSTFGRNAARPKSIDVLYDSGEEVAIKGSIIPEPHASALRNRELRSVTVSLG